MLVAIAIFLMFFISSTFVVKNYYSNLSLYAKKTEALNLCVNKINEAKQTAYASLASKTENIIVDNVSYTAKTTVSNYIKNGSTTVSNTKVVTVEVSFESNGKTDTVNLKIIRVN